MEDTDITEKSEKKPVRTGVRQKREILKMLEDRGYTPVDTFLPRPRLIGLLTIVCNRIDPENPRRAMETLQHNYCRAEEGVSFCSKAWTVKRYEGVLDD